MNNQLLNIIGEIIGVADVVGGDFPLNTPTTVNLGLVSATVSPPSSTPTGQNGATVFQIGNVAINEIYSKNTEHWQGSPGIYSLPALPGGNTDTDACQVLYVNRNNQNIGIAYRDTRYLAGINAQPGDTVLYAPGSTSRVKCSSDGSVYIGTETTATGTFPSGDKTYFQVSPTGLYYKSPWVNISADANGFVVTTASGATFSLGQNAGIPIPSIGSVCNIQAGTINLLGTNVALGAGPVYAPVVIPISPVWPVGTPLPPFTTLASQSVSCSYP
jgi:hypothetical protein